MRIVTFLITSAVLLAACADSETTAPRTKVPAGASASSQQSEAASPQGPIASAKPMTGWTQAQTFFSNPVSLLAGQSGPAIVQCPAGTTPTGGGFEFVNTPGSLVIPPLVTYVGPFAPANGWGVWVTNFANSGAVVTIKANVRCAS